MNYSKIESLVKLAKNGDPSAKEELTTEFTPFILNLLNYCKFCYKYQ